jgi:diguanylate cyclase (GGDEF)-like protein/PAS domain S-box-containing protein
MGKSVLADCVALARAARSLEGKALADTLATLETALVAARALYPEQEPPHAIEQPDEPVLMLDLAGYLTDWNSGTEELFGYTRAEALGQHVLFLYADDEDDSGVAELFLEPGTSLIEARRRKKNGEVIWVRLELSLIHDEAGDPAGMQVVLSPLPEHLAESDKVRLHARIIEDSDQGVLITDAHERIVAINSAFTRITGYAPAEAIGQTPDLLRSGVHDAEFRAKVRAAMKGQGPWRGEIIGKRKSGELFPQSVTISAVRDGAGRITNTFSLFSDISVHKDAEARMQRMANYDSLTGLPNRHLLNQLAGEAMAQTLGAQRFGAVMVIEVNRIGVIGDTLGEEVASELVCELARRLRATLRDEDILARIDGSKFAVALPEIEQREHSGIVAQKLLAALGPPIVTGVHSLQVDASVGIALFPDDSTETATLIRYADVAAARSARSGLDAFLYYREEMDQRAKEHLRLETELRDALAAGELELHYQPKASLRSGRIVGAEALLRWRHPERGMIPPGVFIPLAEESGLIVDIGEWVLEEACRQMRAWRDDGLNPPPVAINISARQFDRRLPARVQDALDRHGVLAGQLMLEITESLLVGGTAGVIAIMNELVAMGVRLALDDFGTGYSSLAYLKKFPISTLKIDRSFVVGLPHEESGCAIARAIVTMGQQLRQEIVAEGVENIKQMAFLSGLGCDQMQGYLFSHAVAPQQFARMLREGARLEGIR